MNNGIYTDLSIEDYHNNTSHFSATQIKHAKVSLKEFEWYRKGLMRFDKKIHFDFGNAFELALLDPIEYEKKVLIYDQDERPDTTKGITSNLNKEWKQKLFDTSLYVINKTGKESFETIQHMMESCYQDAVIQKLICNIEYQLSLFWTDEVSGLRMKTRPDICKRKKNVVVNLKTALDGSPKAFSRELANLDYPLQACIEMEGCIKSGLMDFIDTYFWLVVEKEPPYNATIYEFEKADIMASMDELEYLKNKVARAIKENFFPGYSDRADNKYGILTAEIPLWYRY